MDGTRARLVETHTAVVVFVGDRAYKLKKPVSLGFLDFRQRTAREAACHQEVELNRRIAPDVYLGVADVLDDSGMPCDHLVVMRRLPDALRLSTLVRTPRDMHADIRAIARTLASFHARAARSPAIDAAASPDAVLSLWAETIEQTRRFAGPVLDAGMFDHVAIEAERYVGGRTPLFEERIAGGHICDGHGDLLADDIFCCPDGPRILDCLEFDPRFRHGDVLADLAFLCMDLERLDRPDLAAQLVADYEEFSGTVHPRSLLDHYAAYRAMVRCKVACLRHEQGDSDAANGARKLLGIAVRKVERSRVQLVLVGGLPGTGKSFLAARLSAALGYDLLRSDEIRRDVSGAGRDGHRRDAYRQGIYTASTTAATYAEMLHRARVLLQHGDSVVLDATWNDRHLRQAARRLAWRSLADVCELRCAAPPNVAAGRIDARAGDDVSDATPEVAARMALDADPWPSAICVDTTRDHASTLARALRVVGQSARHRPRHLSAKEIQEIQLCSTTSSSPSTDRHTRAPRSARPPTSRRPRTPG